ncbi:RagB/SusD family nutrient uptake outer membrane protein [Paraflavitalea sp. CAU 1676]|uniref:RagB/SusD family nutrient uptake outer membrane protein n=1 Tax=Paraflavitalea sp. CAU 1676 TaxID=3032598 RepID=UPI0023DA4B3C|nr:RagB/SusD family nutrient uptake outer membrane protein [Paraflavitalea sp. CAU 1676]MDF2188497.1 RagB/SusD family nutrient uptake outer membrane protein [Paraflavitalea sp. CAU 1676]
MKLRKLPILLTIAVALLVQTSCKKQLNALPSQAIVDGNVVVDQKSAEIALNGAYYRFAKATTVLSVLSTGWSFPHEIIPAMMAGSMQYGFGAVYYQTHRFTPTQTGDWGYAYAVLNAANGTIAGVEALPDGSFIGARKKEILAEARFLRAYAHFFLLSYFGEWHTPDSKFGVLLRKEPLTFKNGSAGARSTVKESYDFIMEDIDYAIANGPENRPVHYANKAAAQALKLRVLMSRGQTADYKELINVANALIGNNNYALEANLKDLFLTKGLTSKEVILGIAPYPNQRTRKMNYEFIQSSVFLATSYFKNLLANDPRATWMLRVPPPGTMSFLKDSLYIGKYTGPKYEDAYVFRLTEVYLQKAEAIVRSGGSLVDARNILKEVMGHAGVTNFTAVDNANTAPDLLYQLYLEYVRNLAAEDGIEWFALLRLPFETVKALRPTITSKEQYILPVPATEFQLNPGFGDQNPGYPKQ